MGCLCCTVSACMVIITVRKHYPLTAPRRNYRAHFLTTIDEHTNQQMQVMCIANALTWHDRNFTSMHLSYEIWARAPHVTLAVLVQDNLWTDSADIISHGAPPRVHLTAALTNCVR